MKRTTHAFLTAAAALLLAGPAAAQNPDNENDLQLTAGLDIIYVYSDPSIGVGCPAGTFPPCWATADFFWKVVPKETINHCGGTMEISGLDFFSFDTDYTTVDGSGNNTVLYDIVVTTGLPSGINPGQIEPDPADPGLVMLSFGAGTPVNNAFLPDPGCPPPGFVNGYELEVSIAGGVPGAGIIITADGSTDHVLTHMIPDGQCGPFGCPGAGTCLDGDMALQDGHSSGLFGGIGETQADWLGTGYSAFGGFAIAGALGGIDAVSETPWTVVQFFERTLNMRVDSGTGHLNNDFCFGVPYPAPELGLAGLNFSTGAAGGGFNSIGAQLYSYQGIGNTATVVGTLTPPLSPCLPFGSGDGLALSPLDPLWNFFLTINLGTVVLTDCEGGPPTADPFNDGTLTTPQLGPLPPGVFPFLPLTLYFQGLEAAGGIRSSQVNQITFWP